MTRPGAAAAELLRMLGTKRATVLYPVEKIDVPAGFRGRIEIHDDLCIGCSKCSIVCPSTAIEMVMDKEKRKIKFSGKELSRERHPKVNLLSCIRCGECEEACPTNPKAIILTTRFSGASLERELIVVPTVP